LKVKQEQDLRYAPLYRLPLFVDIWVKGKLQRTAITITKKEQTFTIDADSKPDLVFFDGETQLLADYTHTKSYEEYIFQYKNSTKVLARLEALSFLRGNLDKKEARNVILSAFADKSWEIRQAAAQSFEQYSGDDRNKVAEKLQELIQKDKKSLVRATAINSLATFGNNYSETFRQCFSDSSYAVISNSLYAYYNTGGVDAAKQFEKFEDVDNLVIVIPIADFYAAYQTPNKYDWFAQKLHKFENSGITYLLGYFGQYVINQPKLVQNEAANYLEDLATNHSNHNARMMAYQTLSLLSIEGIERRLALVRRKEKDKRVLEYYKMME
jgi:aminopeptidase N